MRSGRRGFSLLEVILAAGMLLACLAVLAPLATEGRHHVDDIDALSRAQLACQTRLNELLSGAIGLAEVENEPLSDLPGWVVRVAIEPLERPGVSALRVTVSVAPDEEDEETADMAERPIGPKFTLVRWIRDTQAGTADMGSRPGRGALLDREEDRAGLLEDRAGLLEDRAGLPEDGAGLPEDDLLRP